jgi:hypothetical protein
MELQEALRSQQLCWEVTSNVRTRPPARRTLAPRPAAATVKPRGNLILKRLQPTWFYRRIGSLTPKIRARSESFPCSSHVTQSNNANFGKQPTAGSFRTFNPIAKSPITRSKFAEAPQTDHPNRWMAPYFCYYGFIDFPKPCSANFSVS